MILTKNRLFSILAGLMLAFNAAVVASSQTSLKIPAGIVVFLFLVSIPGVLILHLLRAKLDDAWHYAYFSVTLSLIFLMITGLLTNWVLPLLGLNQPLAMHHLLPSLDIALAGLFFAAQTRTTFGRKPMQIHLKITWGYLWPVGFPILAALGATSLNNGGPNWFTLAMIAGVTVFFGYAIATRQKFSENHVRWAIFCSTLGLLLMTSLRGWHITGHDIQREFAVMQLTTANWQWNIADLRDPYNACLSITILPALFASLMHIDQAYVYKLLFQVLFALSPVAVYLLMRHFAARRLAVLATFFYVAFPTFFTDMPFLNRQEIAFLMLGSLFLTLFSTSLSIKIKRILFIIFGSGVVISHYSTTYSLIAILIAATIIMGILRRKPVHKILMKLTNHGSVELPEPVREQQKPFITLLLISSLIGVSFIWNTGLTGTTGNLGDVASRALAGITGQSDTGQSSDTKASLFSWKQPDPKVTFQKLMQDSIRDNQDSNSTDLYKEAASQAYQPTYLPEANLPLTNVGQLLKTLHADPTTLNNILRQGWAKFLQVLVFIGLIVLFLKRRYHYQSNADYLGLTLASIVFITSLVVIPSLSVDYGLLRGFQQMLILLALPAAVGTYVLMGWIKSRWRWTATSLLALTFFLSTSGLVPEITGGYMPQLFLHNRGIYHETYLHETDIDAMNWLEQNASSEGGPIEIQADQFGALKLRTNTTLVPTNNILPAVIDRDAYVYLDYTNVVLDRAYLMSANDSYGYTLSTEFFDSNKDLIYSNGSAEIYR